MYVNFLFQDKGGRVAFITSKFKQSGRHFEILIIFIRLTERTQFLKSILSTF